MSVRITISVADSVFAEIDTKMTAEGKKNRSEYVEDLIRAGLQKKGGANGDKSS